MDKVKIDNQFFETVIAYHLLTNEEYLGTVIDTIDTKYFNNKDIKTVVELITDFFMKRGEAPTLTELKSYLSTDELKTSFKNVVKLFEDVDKDYNSDELYEKVAELPQVTSAMRLGFAQ